MKSFNVINGIRHNTIISKIINRLHIPYIYIYIYIYLNIFIKLVSVKDFFRISKENLQFSRTSTFMTSL